MNTLATDAGVTGATVYQSGPQIYDIVFPGLAATLTATLTGGGGAPEVVDGGGTLIASGASLQIQGGLSITGEPLVISGSGVATTPSVPAQWFNVGQSAGFAATSVATAPNNSNFVVGAVTAVGNETYTGSGAFATLPGDLAAPARSRPYPMPPTTASTSLPTPTRALLSCSPSSVMV